MGVEEAMDLVDSVPGLVLRQVSSDRVERAKELLEGLGATVTVSSDPDEASVGSPSYQF